VRSPEDVLLKEIPIHYKLVDFGSAIKIKESKSELEKHANKNDSLKTFNQMHFAG
jgi:hypothetical protein